MDGSVFNLVSEVIAKSSRTAPADSVLRETLRNRRGLSREDGARISRLVFAYFRWLGWLQSDESLPEQIRKASDLADRFATRPESFTDKEIVERSVPAWLSQEMEVAAEWARSLQLEPKLWLRARRGHGKS